MALSSLKMKVTSQSTQYYQDYYHVFIIGAMGIIVIILIATSFLVYQLHHRPVPLFYAVQPNGYQRVLTAYEEPNFLPDTILRFASKAATTAYTFVFSNINNNLALAKPYFTEAGWTSYRASVDGLISGVVKNQLFVDGIVSGVPVISNQGVLPAKGYTWRVQIPFLVVYQSANTTTTRKFIVVVTLVKVPTYVNPRGIGVDQFVMLNG
jgi:intracellular multiplication protein IcmL